MMHVHWCRREEAVDEASRGHYSTHVLGARAVEIVRQHAAALDSAAPLFLYLAFQSVHAPLQAKNPPSKKRILEEVRTTLLSSNLVPPFFPLLSAVSATQREERLRERRGRCCENWGGGEVRASE